MKKVLLNNELDEKYSSQLEYMGHMNLEHMELSDGNHAIIENGNFFICYPEIEIEDNIVKAEFIPNPYSMSIRENYKEVINNVRNN